MQLKGSGEKGAEPDHPDIGRNKSGLSCIYYRLGTHANWNPSSDPREADSIAYHFLDQVLG